ncbi:uncharacterized protein LOC126895320 [Daktulosphaira vitifoliae]|uniref:uncharacterized protein LOC126895320 n=1 Tax=Daktulosphaira vitifoliae TaxID=58002 RepID=UPI0021AAD45D|nr:uncharacterized protein LOC126895320 [Daktulosphaira vitifoliae]
MNEENGNISLTNVVNNELFSYSTILIKGFIRNVVDNDSKLLIEHSFNYNASNNTSLWTVFKNNFKVILELKHGDNLITLKYGKSILTTKLVFKPRRTKFTVQPIYVICSDHDGKFQAPKDHDNSVHVACKKIVLGLKLIQMLTAEKMDEQGFGKKTFQIENDCQIIKSSLIRESVFKMNPEKLWEHIAREITANYNSYVKKFLAFLSCTYWDGKNLHGHVALGGGGLALFGTGCLYTWPSELEEILPCFMNMKKVNTSLLLDDSCFRGNFGGCFSTTLGSVWHEIGHIFDLGHSKYGIMGRGFDNVHLTFTLDGKNIAQENVFKKKTYAVYIEENCINNLNDNKIDLPNNNSSKLCNAIKNNESKTVCWSIGCASILSVHKWFNTFNEKNINENIPNYVKKRNLITSDIGLKVVQLRHDDGSVIHSWEFFKPNKRIFILPIQHINIGLTIFAIDLNGNMLKQLL